MSRDPDEELRLTLLQSSLQVAVPLEVERLRRYSLEEIIEQGRACTDVIASKGDIILYRSKKVGETAAAFSKLATAIATCSFLPGGIKIFDLHWQSTLEEGLRVSGLKQV